MSEFEIYSDDDSLAQAAAEHFVVQAAAAIETHGRFLVALAGGSTPRAAYALLAGDAFAPHVDWSRVHVLWGDERCVPPDHPQSNYPMARETLLDRVPILAASVHRIRGELDPARPAAAYETELKTTLGAGGRFDLILLGMGSDGHTVSLFPA